VLEPLLTVATRVLLPVLKLDDKICFELAVPVRGAPFRAQVVVQLASPGVTENVLLVEAAAAILGVAEAGNALAIEQAGKTFTVQLH
jgi:hypothetical protein